jgi:hypothetical protein
MDHSSHAMDHSLHATDHNLCPEEAESDADYTFLEELGRGSSAVVRRAKSNGQEVAVKMFHEIGKDSTELKYQMLSAGTEKQMKKHKIQKIEI